MSFTTPERDQIIKKSPGARAAVEALKERYLVGLHHNWHDRDFAYDPLFDFSMAGDGDLIERDGKKFARVPIDACNFAPPCFASGPRTNPQWDVLNASRAVAFKGIPEFFKAVRTVYDRGRPIRVLHLCPVPPAEGNGTTLHDLRDLFESLFSPSERQLFNLITMEWDYPFPLDLETLAFFYRSSRVLVHAAPDERRCRTAAYAWVGKMPVVARENVGSILPADLRREPFLYRFENDNEMADAILRSLDASHDDLQWGDVADQFSGVPSGERLGAFLNGLADSRGQRSSKQPINVSRLDIRLGRHHMNALGPNGMAQDLVSFCGNLLSLDYGEIAAAAGAPDPEARIGELRGPGRMARLVGRLPRW